jgi:diguanylate cyclase (GGDEF)-like protein
MPLQLEGKQGFLRWETVGESGLIALTFVAPGDLALEGEQNRIVIAVVIVSLVVGSALVFLFLRIHIVRPMRELGDDLLAISLDGNVGYRLPPGRNQSLGVFRRTLNVTLHKAQEHHEQIIRQQAELSQAYKQLKDHEQILHGQYVQLKENKEKIRFLAEYDGLTGLPNRRRFQDDLQEALDKGESGVVILIDLDDFKNINDTQGHSFGDDVLCSVAQGLQEELTPGATAYRFGGDEFALIVQHQTSPADLKMSADCTLERLHAITSKEGKKFSVTSSMGVVSYPVDGRTVDELLIKVDIALHHVKTAGKNHYVFFEESMVEVFNERVQMEEILAEAVRTNGFYLVYQPIVATRTGTIVSFEALVRLKNHAVLPSVFMPIAEESDLTISLGYWVIKEVMGQLATWRAEGKTPKAVSVNLSLKQFHDPNLIGFLTEQLRESGIDSSLFEVEFPEEVLLGHAEKALQTMEGLKRLGISQSLDDYGSGYSFIDYMTKMPVDYLKVHGSFTENIQTNPHVMEGLISIAHGLGMEIVAEQVETLDQARGLSQISCDYLQGHLFCPPVVSQEAELLFELNYAQILNFDQKKGSS